MNVDSTKTINCVEWCFGYGGNHLGLKRVLPSLRCLAACEIEAYAIANLVAKIETGLLDPFPIWTDVKTFPCELFRDLVDIFVASYPCQPFSSSGKRKGADDPRHLWPFVRRAVEIIRPRFCFFENVEGHVSLGLREVLTELALLGYRVENSRGEPTFGIFSAAEERAPQGRKRVFILAKREGVDLVDALCEQIERFNAGRFSPCVMRTSELANAGLEPIRPEQWEQQKEHSEELSSGVKLEDSQGGRDGEISKRPWNEGVGETEPDRASEGVGQANPSDDKRKRSTGKRDSRPGKSSERFSEGCLGVGQADAKTEGLQRPWLLRRPADNRPIYWPAFVARPGQKQNKWEPTRTIKTERGLGGGVNGRSANVDRLRLLGNGVYPATAANAFATLMMRSMQ